jgi:2-polyprenyl-3-methyl-5-hydroxy-6-metoxy-1,4-benzoquinol methylase
MTENASSSNTRADHWETAYERRGVTEVSWFQTEPVVSLELIEVLGVRRDAAVVDIGGGASSLVDHLVERGFTDLSVLDISETALRAAYQRLGVSVPVSWLHEDLLFWRPGRQFDLWHDRAVFHFLVDKEDRDAYLETLRSGIAPGGALIVATFAEDGPEYCSGLPVARYSAVDLGSVLGDGFVVVETRRELHTTPAGVPQPFTWVAARAAP